MEVQVQVAGPITSKPVGNGNKFDIPLSNGTKPSTFDAALATKISSFGSGFFTATIEEKPSKDGQRIFLNIVAAELGATAGTPLGASAAAQNGSQGFGGMSPEREIKIVKQSMIAAAANLVGHVYSGPGSPGPKVSLADAEEHVERIAKKWFGIVFGVAKAAEPVAAVAVDPQAVAAFVAEQAGSPVVQVGTGGLSAEPDALPWP